MHELIAFLNSLPPEAISLAMIFMAYGGALFMMRAFGLNGLIAFVIVAIIGANIQVIKTAQFSVFTHPVALGTELFASTYLVMDIITEFYGAARARKVIWIGFACQLLFSAFMILLLGYHPVDTTAGSDAAVVESALSTILQPQPGLVAAGMISYLISQNLDVTIYSWMKRQTHGGSLWLRNQFSNVAAALIDNTIFSVFAWEIFAEKPVPIDSLIFTYILGTFWIRVIISAGDLPFMYLSRKIFAHSGEKAAQA